MPRYGTIDIEARIPTYRVAAMEFEKERPVACILSDKADAIAAGREHNDRDWRDLEV